MPHPFFWGGGNNKTLELYLPSVSSYSLASSRWRDVTLRKKKVSLRIFKKLKEIYKVLKSFQYPIIKCFGM